MRGHRVKVAHSEPIVREVKPRNMDVFTSGLTIAISYTVVIGKLVFTHDKNNKAKRQYQSGQKSPVLRRRGYHQRRKNNQNPHSELKKHTFLVS
ncbi:hypothetical protein ACJMK2_032965 [Sinanodonta woodiana]|uniref:Uncharacterized protein n=1 Tax=Sinanodonta woodiana TaxID=1069815 RepID=A0ABD3X6Y6_SINWO